MTRPKSIFIDEKEEITYLSAREERQRMNNNLVKFNKKYEEIAASEIANLEKLYDTSTPSTQGIKGSFIDAAVEYRAYSDLIWEAVINKAAEKESGFCNYDLRQLDKIFGELNEYKEELKGLGSPNSIWTESESKLLNTLLKEGLFIYKLKEMG